MKIAILTSGILPVPAVQGGAVENLIDFYLEYNNIHKLHDITIYSCKHHETRKHPALKSNVNHYYYIDTSSLLAKIKKRLYLKKAGGKEFHHFTIEYFLNQAVKHIRKQSYDLFILENRPPFSLKIKQVTQAKIVYHIHNKILFKESDYAKELYQAADLIIGVSDYITRCIKSICPQDNKCITVHNGIDLKAFSLLKESNIKRSTLGLSNDDFVLIFSGRITPENGISELLDAMIALHNIINIKLLVIGSSFYGSNNQEDGFTKSLKDKSEIIKDSIIFTGYIPYNLVPSYLWISDVAIVPSIWDEPFGNTVVEAMAAKLPLIATRSGGIPEICEGVATIVERENIVDNLVNAILDLYQHPEKREAMAKASHERSKLFDKETYAKNFFTAIERI